VGLATQVDARLRWFVSHNETSRRETSQLALQTATSALGPAAGEPKDVRVGLRADVIEGCG
jgi:hypothetical protein